VWSKPVGKKYHTREWWAVPTAVPTLLMQRLLTTPSQRRKVALAAEGALPGELAPGANSACAKNRNDIALFL